MTRRGPPAAPLPLRADDLALALDEAVQSPPTGIVVAVSGGPDSICLMHLMAELRPGLGSPVVVATVDHGLRSASRTEAEFVLAEAGRIGLPAHLLTWEGTKPDRAIQEKARAARYGLLTGLCRTLGASHLLTAHTLDDQAETVLFRLIRGSGPTGLAGMRPRVVRDGIVHARPLLGIPKARLLAACEGRGWAYVDDPSNLDPRFARPRLRATLLPRLAAEGLDAARLGTLATRVARCEAALREAADQLAAHARLDAEAGARRFDAGRLAAAPLELVIRVLGSAVQEVGCAGTPRLDRLEKVAAGLQTAVARGEALKRTLAGTILSMSAEKVLDVRAEGARRRGAPARAAHAVHRVGRE